MRAHGALIPSAHSPFPAQTALECRRGTEERAPCPPSRPAGNRLTVAAPSAGSTGRRRPSAWRELAPLGPAPRPPAPMLRAMCRAYPEGGGTAACGARPAMPAAGTRLTCAGWAAEGGPAPPRPRARAFPAAQSAAIGLPVPGRPLAKPHLGRRRGE